MISVMLDNDIAGHGDLFDGTLHTAPAGMNIDSSSLSLCKKPELRAMRPTVKCGVFVQQRGLILLTANRNLDDESSLEQTLREDNTPESLPIITVSAPQRIVEPEYRERCMHALIGIVLDLDNCLGAARLYIP